MTAEKLHDAISALPADLIAEADKQRRAPRPVIHWQRYAAMAACFALMLCGSVWCLRNLGLGGAKEAAAQAPAAIMQAAEDAAFPKTQAAAEAAPKEYAAAGDNDKTAESVQGTNSTACNASLPAVTFYIDGIPYELAEEDRSTVAGLLLKLDYRKELVCECIAEITIVIGEMEYSLNLEEGFIRGAEGQASLTDKQIDSLRQITDTLVN